MKRLLCITLTALSYQITQAAAMQLIDSNKRVKLEQQAHAQPAFAGYEGQAAGEALQKSQEQAVKNNKSVDEILQAYFPAVLHSIIRAYALNPLHFAPCLYQPVTRIPIPDPDRDTPYYALGVQSDDVIIVNSDNNRVNILVFDHGECINNFPDNGTNRITMQSSYQLRPDGTVIKRSTYGSDTSIDFYRYSGKKWENVKNLSYPADLGLAECHAPDLLALCDGKNHYVFNTNDGRLVALYLEDRKRHSTGQDRFIVTKNGITVKLDYQDADPKDHHYRCQLYNRNGSLLAETRDPDLSKLYPRAISPQGTFLLHYFDSTAYARTPDFALKDTLEVKVYGDHNRIEGSAICSDETVLIGYGDNTVRAYSAGNMVSMLRYKKPIHKITEYHDTIISLHNGLQCRGDYDDELCICRPDAQLTTFFEKYSFAQQQEIMELIRVLGEMYWMEYDSILPIRTIRNFYQQRNQWDEARANIELTLFGKHAETFKMLDPKMQHNIMSNMQCKISVKQPQGAQTTNSR